MQTPQISRIITPPMTNNYTNNLNHCSNPHPSKTISVSIGSMFSSADMSGNTSINGGENTVWEDAQGRDRPGRSVGKIVRNCGGRNKVSISYEAVLNHNNSNNTIHLKTEQPSPHPYPHFPTQKTPLKTQSLTNSRTVPTTKPRAYTQLEQQQIVNKHNRTCAPSLLNKQFQRHKSYDKENNNKDKEDKRKDKYPDRDTYVSSGKDYMQKVVGYKYRLKSEVQLEGYQSKLAMYQRNKRQVLKDIGRINTNPEYFLNKYQKQLAKTPITQTNQLRTIEGFDNNYNNTNNNNKKNKKQNFLIFKLKNSLKPAHFGIQEQYYGNEDIFENEQDRAGERDVCWRKENNIYRSNKTNIPNKYTTPQNNYPHHNLTQTVAQLDPSPTQQRSLSPTLNKIISSIQSQKEVQKFLNQLEKHIRIEAQLRKLKNMCNGCKREVWDVLGGWGMGDYEIQRLIGLDYEEYEFETSACNSNRISPQTLCESLLKTHKNCHRNWQQALHKKFPQSTIKAVYSKLNGNRLQAQVRTQAQINLKSFTRQFNISFETHYHARDLYRVWGKVRPGGLGDFLTVFSQ